MFDKGKWCSRDQLGSLKPREIVWEKVGFPAIPLTLFRSMASGVEVSK